MAGRFHYRPVDPGYDRMGQGLAAGIFGATDQYARAKERDRRKPMEDLVEARALAEAAEQGIHQGTAPVRPRTEIDIPAGPDFSMAEPGFGMQPGAQSGGLGVRAEGGGGGLGLKLMPNADWVQPQPGGIIQQEQPGIRQDFSQWEADPAFAQINDSFYGMTPDAREAKGRMAADEARQGRIASLEDLGANGITPQAVEAFPELLDEYIAASGHAPAEESEFRNLPGVPGWVFNSKTGEAQKVADAPGKAPEEVNGQLKPGADGFYYLINPRTGKTTKTDVRVPPSGGGADGGISPTSFYTNKARLAHSYVDEYRRIRSWEPKKGESPEEFAAAQEQAIADLTADYDLTIDEARELIRTGEWPGGEEGMDEDADVGGPASQGIAIEDYMGPGFFTGEDPAAPARGNGGRDFSFDDIDPSRDLESQLPPGFTTDTVDVEPDYQRITVNPPRGPRVPERGAEPEDVARATSGAPADTGSRPSRGGRLTREEADSARALISKFGGGMTREQQEALLREEGASDEDIEAILGPADESEEAMVERFLR